MEGSAVLHRADSEETMELWDVYDIDRQKTGKLAQRVNGKSMPEGEYHLVVHICLFNAKGQLLIQQRQLDKIGYPGLWDVTAAGSALAGENSASAAARELWEEMGIRHDFHGERPFYTINFPDGFDDVYLIEKMMLHFLTCIYSRRKSETQNGQPSKKSKRCSTAGSLSPITAIWFVCGLRW